MSSSADPVEYVSVVTIGALQDIGYQVNYGAAEGYDKSHLQPACVCKRRGLQQQPSPPQNSSSIVAQAPDPFSAQDYDNIRAFASTELNQFLSRTDSGNATDAVQCAMSVMVQKGDYVKDVVITELC
jgi:hypothetical protein